MKKKTSVKLTEAESEITSAESLIEHIMINIVDVADDDNVRDDCYRYADGDITKAQLIKRLNEEVKNHEVAMKEIIYILKELAKEPYPKKVPQVVFDLREKPLCKKIIK
jgi:hypothetical protein